MQGKKVDSDSIAKTLSVNFLYMPPPGLKSALEKEEKERKEKEAQQASNLQQASSSASAPAVTSSRFQSKKKVPLRDIPLEERFPFLKNAPTQGTFTENVPIKHKPFGIEIRNVKCARCGQFGHSSGDRECPLRDFNPNDAQRQMLEDPLTLINEQEQALRNNSKIQIKHMGPKLNLDDPNQQLVLSDDDDDNGDKGLREANPNDPLADLSEKDIAKILKQVHSPF